MDILKELRNNAVTPCVSVIIPTHKKSPDRMLDELEVEKMLKKAEELVLDKYGKNNGGEELVNKLSELAENIDYLHNNLGIGFFVSPKMSHLVKFPFPVNEKLIIGNSFEIRDMIYLAETMINYYVLLINEKEIKLFEGSGENLKLVKDNHFPLHFIDDYEYSRPSLGSSYGYSLKSTEKDKSIVNEQRFTTFLKKADQNLSKYLSTNTPLIICGDSKDIGYFKKNSVNSENVVGVVHGNYIHESVQSLGTLCFDKIKEHLNAEEDNILKRLENAMNKRLAVSGIENVWKAAKDGKGLILLVEKDFAIQGFVTNEDLNFTINLPKKRHEVITDAVDDVMETVFERGGKVIVVENDKLLKYDRISMILRYW